MARAVSRAVSVAQARDVIRRLSLEDALNGSPPLSGSPLDPLVHLLTTLAVAIGAAAAVTLSAVLFLRWMGLHWSWTLPGVLLGPALWAFDPEAAAFVAATAVLASTTGWRWHHDDLRRGGQGRVA